MPGSGWSAPVQCKIRRLEWPVFLCFCFFGACGIMTTDFYLRLHPPHNTQRDNDIRVPATCHTALLYFAPRLRPEVTTGRSLPLMKSKDSTAGSSHFGLHLGQRLRNLKEKLPKISRLPHDSGSSPPSKAESAVDTGLDTLILVAGLVEKISNVAAKVPLVGAGAALVSEVVKTEAKDMRGARDALATDLQAREKDYGTVTSGRSHDHLSEHLKEDLEIYHSLLVDTSKLVSDFDAAGILKDLQYAAWKKKFDDLEKKINSFQGRFIVNRTTEIQATMETQTLQEKLYKWLGSPPDQMIKQGEMQKLRYGNTGSWFLNGAKFREWKDNPGSLWIEGNSGTGKSVLWQERRSQDLEVMLRSITFQLSAQSSHPHLALDRLHKSFNGGTVPPHDEDLIKVIHQLLMERGRSYIVLDALDECIEDDFPALIRLIQRLFSDPADKHLHLLITSQPRQLFKNAFANMSCITLESDTEDDIRAFVTSKVAEVKKWATQAERVTEQVVLKSSGMFRLADCLLKELSKCLSYEWEETLNSLPKDLYGIYDRFLSRVSSKHLIYVEAIFRWLMFSAHRIHLDQLADAISFDFSDPSRFRYEPMRRQDMSSAILQWLDGLVVLKRVKQYEPGKGIVVHEEVVIAHASVQDYVLSTQFSNQFAQSRNFTDRASNAFIAQSCICYLLHFADPAHTLNAETLPNYPLSLYAAEYWPHHLQRSDSQEALFDLMMHLFEEGSSQYTALTHLHDSAEPWNDSPDWTRPIPPPLALCSNLGYTDGVRYLLEKGADPDTMGAEYGTPLQTAVSKGFLEIVRLLLGKGANLYPPNTGWFSPLRMACRKGHKEMVQILLDHGALVNAPDEKVGEVFCRTEDTEILQMLLQNGAVTDDGLRHGLAEALKDGTLEIVRHLLNSVPIDQAGRIAGKVMRATSKLRESQHETNDRRAAIIDLLIDNGLDVDGMGTALHVAARNANHEFVELLLDRGADVNNIPEWGFGNTTALQKAVSFKNPRWDQSVILWDCARRIKTVRILVDRGANIDADGGEYGTALQLAAQCGRAEIIEILLENGASIDADPINIGTALRLALDKGDHNVIEILRKHGASQDAAVLQLGPNLEADRRRITDALTHDSDLSDDLDSEEEEEEEEGEELTDDSDSDSD
ncbi:hypothetical protein B0H19DRAFT_1231288 [Mycena capillaripes]|nr:hypothetical protein B0H19DRAFT_1231288 [Mycena capillaripes]